MQIDDLYTKIAALEISNLQSQAKITALESQVKRIQEAYPLCGEKQS